jgi:hypothetical protein
MANEIIDPESCEKRQPIQEYSHLQEFIDNLPYMVMVVLGAVIFRTGFESVVLGWVTAALYFAYGLLGALWIILFVCPYCHFYDTSSCPCGYGQISAKLRPKKDDSLFIKKFKKHIPVIVPLWIAPVIAGVVFLIKGFSTWMLMLVVVFAIDSFILLPLMSTKYGCAHCPQRDVCPWMKHKGQIPHQDEPVPE